MAAKPGIMSSVKDTEPADGTSSESIGLLKMNMAAKPGIMSSVKDTEPADGTSSESSGLLKMESEPSQYEWHLTGYGIWTAAVFIVSVVANVGVLVLPSALSKTGWTGVPVMLFFAIIQLYCGILLGRCWSILQERFEIYKQQTRHPYAAIGYESFGNVGRIMVVITLNITLLGYCVAYILIISENIVILFHMIDLNMCFVLVIAALCLCPISWFGTPKDFWPIAVVGVLTTGLSCLLLCMRIVSEFPLYPRSTVTYTVPSFVSYFSGVGIFMIVFNGHPTFPTIQHDMIDPTKFPKSLKIGGCVILLYFMPLSVLGYYIYGDALVDKENLFQIISPNWEVTIAIVMITMHVVCSFTIFVNPICQEFEEFVGIPMYFTWKRVVMRVSIILLVLFMASSIPTFGTVLSFLGGTTIIMLSLVYPPLFYFKLCATESPTGDWEKITLSTFDKTLIVVIIAIGIIVLVTATYSNIVVYGGQVFNFSRPCYLPD